MPGSDRVPLNLIYITNNPDIARIAEESGVNKIMVDLEKIGKEDRQRNMNTVKSNHRLEDIKGIANVLTKAELLVRINPWHEHSVSEIEAVISAGADSIMLPMWKSEAEADAFLKTVNRRVGTTLLLETKEAVKCIDAVLDHPLLDNIHIGLNDLHLSYGLTFMFELFSNGVVEYLCKKCRAKEIPCGVGGIGRLHKGLVPSECVIMEHYRLGSTAAILSRTFCNAEEINDLSLVKAVFRERMEILREFEYRLGAKTQADYTANQRIMAKYVKKAVWQIQEMQANAKLKLYAEGNAGAYETGVYKYVQ